MAAGGAGNSCPYYDPTETLCSLATQAGRCHRQITVFEHCWQEELHRDTPEQPQALDAGWDLTLVWIQEEGPPGLLSDSVAVRSSTISDAFGMFQTFRNWAYNTERAAAGKLWVRLAGRQVPNQWLCHTLSPGAMCIPPNVLSSKFFPVPPLHLRAFMQATPCPSKQVL